MADPRQPKPAASANGDFGENIAAAHLARHGFACLEFNFRTKYGEIDIIAQDERYLLFVEVKTRGPNARTSGEEAVGYQKQNRLRAAAEYYLITHRSTRQPRFDVICVDTAWDGQVAAVRWHENAF